MQINNLFPSDIDVEIEDEDYTNELDITGSLYLVNKYGESVEPTQETFNTDFYLAWVE